jgi:REP element-mobilizing transposase RayT
MARPLRIQYENAYYHVTCRGNARQGIFANDQDRSAFLDLLNRSRQIYQVQVLAYVLMRNHFHLVVKTPLGNLQEFMRHFNISYTCYFNRRHKRVGHLYQGRYKAFLIDADSYLQEVTRYLHLNPIRVKGKADLVVKEKKRDLERYSWSSYVYYVGRRKGNSFLASEEILGYFGGNASRGRRNYRKFVEEGLEGEIESPLQKGRGHGIVGDEDFVEGVRDRFLKRIRESREVPGFKGIISRTAPAKILGVVCKEMGVNGEELQKKGERRIGRGLLMEMLYRYGGLNQREIGEMMGVDYSSVSVARKRFQLLSEGDKKVLELMERVQNKMSQG